MTRNIVWKSEYNTGNTMVDQEHHELINLVNLLLAADSNAYSEDALETAFDALQRYLDKHFTDEENLLDSVDSSHLEIQRKQHQILRRELDTLWSPEHDIPKKKVMHELALWAKNRLLNHFLTFDFRAFHDYPFVGG